MNSYSVGLVSYGSARRAVAAIASVLAQDPLPSRVVVVENAQDVGAWRQWDEAARELGIQFDVGGTATLHSARSVITGSSHGVQFQVLWSQVNLGFSAGNNMALSHGGGAEHFLSLNPDCNLFPGAVRVMLDELEPRTGVISGVLLKGDGGQPSRLAGGPPLRGEVVDAAAGEVGGLTGRTTLLKVPIHGVTKLVLPARWPRRSVTYAGACALFVRSALEDVGGFQEEFFLYYDEFATAQALLSRNWHVRLLPDVLGSHDRHSSTREDGRKSSLEAYHASRSATLAAFRLGPMAVLSWTLARAALGLVRGITRLPLGKATFRGIVQGFRDAS